MKPAGVGPVSGDGERSGATGREVAGGDDENGGAGKPVELLGIVHSRRAELHRTVLAVEAEPVQFAQDTAGPGRAGGGIDRGEFGDGRRRDVQEFRRDCLFVGDPDPADDMYRLVARHVEHGHH